ncbi:hypothetical protein C3L29_030840 [Pseudomonas sp. MWU12-2534b]|nr:hypothetical protein C3L29_030840 [Pseudomonas sp. MWU12-2534b]
MILNHGAGFSDKLIGFVVACFFCGAVTRRELNDWSAHALVLEGAPNYLYDLMEFHDEPFKIYKVIGHVPDWECTEREERALYGIAVRRGFEPYDMPLTPNEALECLAGSPDIERLFRQVFDFIEY